MCEQFLSTWERAPSRLWCLTSGQLGLRSIGLRSTNRQPGRPTRSSSAGPARHMSSPWRRPERPASADDHPAGTGYVVAGVKGPPAVLEVGLEPSTEVHGPVGSGDAHIGQVAEDIAGRDIEAPAQGKPEVGEVAADAGAALPHVERRGQRVAAPQLELDVFVRPVQTATTRGQPGSVAPKSSQAWSRNTSDRQKRLGSRKTIVSSGSNSTGTWRACGVGLI